MAAWDSIKSAFRTITGTSAHVTMRLTQREVSLGGYVELEVTVRGKGAPVEARALLIDVVATEEVRAILGLSMDRTMHNLVDPKSALDRFGFPHQSPVAVTLKTFERAAKVTGPARFEGDDTRTFRARVHIPREAQPSYRGTFVTHHWQLRARLDVLGADPSSAWCPVVVCQPVSDVAGDA